MMIYNIHKCRNGPTMSGWVIY